MSKPTLPNLTLHNYRVEYVAPARPEHDFEPTCAILANDSEFNDDVVRVFDVPDPDEDQRAVAEFACRSMNTNAALVSFVKYVRDFYQQNFDVMPVAFQTVDSEAESLLRLIK
jgi:hypothetical protein